MKPLSSSEKALIIRLLKTHARVVDTAIRNGRLYDDEVRGYTQEATDALKAVEVLENTFVTGFVERNDLLEELRDAGYMVTPGMLTDEVCQRWADAIAEAEQYTIERADEVYHYAISEAREQLYNDLELNRYHPWRFGFRKPYMSEVSGRGGDELAVSFADPYAVPSKLERIGWLIEFSDQLDKEELEKEMRDGDIAFWHHTMLFRPSIPFDSNDRWRDLEALIEQYDTPDPMPRPEA
jgi:hypothetical protein